MNIIKEFANRHDTTIWYISKISGLSRSSLNEWEGKKLENMKVKILNGLALVTGLENYEVLKELNEIEGNPIINFMNDFPDLDPDLRTRVDNLLIEAYRNKISISNVSFNRFYEEGKTTTKDAEIALENMIEFLKEKMEIIKEKEDDTWI